MATKLTPNGYGRWQQTIMFHVPKCHSKVVSDRMGLTQIERQVDDGRASFEWTRLTTRPGNDEDVAWDLSMHLKDAQNVLDWRIDWRTSDY